MDIHLEKNNWRVVNIYDSFIIYFKTIYQASHKSKIFLSARGELFFHTLIRRLSITYEYSWILDFLCDFHIFMMNVLQKQTNKKNLSSKILNNNILQITPILLIFFFKVFSIQFSDDNWSQGYLHKDLLAFSVYDANND